MSLPSNRKTLFYLAPMYDVTDTVFRSIIADLASPDVFYTEFVNVDGLNSEGSSALLPKLKFSKIETPIIAQVWGANPNNFHKTAKELVKLGFSGIDINMGCPDKNVTNQGLCSALINNRELAAEIISATKKGAAKLPISVKTRLGYSDIDYSWHEFLLEQDIDMLVIHGRTKKQMSKVPADWEAINNIRKLRDKISPKTKIVGNGDVMSRSQGEDLANKYKLDGIMVGRGVFQDPYIFSRNSRWEKMLPKDKIKIYKDHALRFKKEYGNSRPVYILNKFCKIYINNFDGAKEIREKLMNSKSIDDLLENLDQL